MPKKYLGTGLELAAAADAASEALRKDQFDAHIDEDDTFVHNADKVASASTVGQGNVEDDLSTLDSEKADAAAVTAQLDGLYDLAGGQPSVGVYGQATRVFYEDDFRWSHEVQTSGMIGETFNRRTGGTSAVGVNNVFHPGTVQISTGTASGTYTVLYGNAQNVIRMDQPFDFHCWFTVSAVGAQTLARVGLSVDPTDETPDDAVFFEKLGADSAFWRHVTRDSSTESRTTSATATTAATWTHVRIRRLSGTNVGFSSSEAVLGIGTDLGTEESVTFAPGNVYATPFIAVKNGDTSSKSITIDRWQLLMWDQTR